MNNKGQVIILTLWVIAILTLLAISLGAKTDQAINLSGSQMDKVRSLSLARAGLERAIEKIVQDSSGYDGLDESWSDNQYDFKNIRVAGDPHGAATVSYTQQEDDMVKTVYGLTDEERKININSAPQQLLAEGLRAAGISDPDRVAENICAWRGLKGAKIPDYAQRGYENKAMDFMIPQELLFIDGMESVDWSKIQDYVTVWGSGKVNINTATKSVLQALIEFSRKNISSGENDPGDLAARITEVRPISSLDELTDKLMEDKALTSAQINILNQLMPLIDVSSQYFRAEAMGIVFPSDIRCDIECVFNRKDKKVVYWHEK